MKQFWSERYGDVLNLIDIIRKLPAMGCLWRHQYNLATFERLAHISNSPGTLTFNNQRELPCRLLMAANLL